MISKNKAVIKENEKITKLRKATKKSKSLLTNVPIDIVNLVGLTDAVYVKWSWKLNDKKEYEFKITFEVDESENDSEKQVSLKDYEK